jgi:phage terminase large subunit-like protein
MHVNVLADELAAQAGGLLQAASHNDEVGTRRHHRVLTLWCREHLEAGLEAALAIADRMIATVDPDADRIGRHGTAGVCITGQVTALRHTVRNLEEGASMQDAAVQTIHLRRHLHHLVRVLEHHAASGLLDDLHDAQRALAAV